MVFSIAAISTILFTMTFSSAYAQPTIYGMTTSGPSGPSNFYQVDSATGDTILIGPTGFSRCSAMDFDSSGTLWAVCGGDDPVRDAVTITIDPDTGLGTEVSNPPNFNTYGDAYTGMSFRNSDDVLFVYLDPGDGVGTLDPLVGTLTELGDSFAGCCGNGMAFSSGDLLYHANDIDLNIIDKITGEAFFEFPLSYDSISFDDFPRINGMDFDPQSEILYASIRTDAPASFFGTIDVLTGNIVVLGPTINKLDAIAIAPQIVIGGELLSLDNSALLLAGVQSVSMWMIPVVVSGAGIGIFMIKRRI
jgi:hypothetical protein